MEARPKLGSDAWTNAAEYDGEYTTRIVYVIENLNRQALISYVSKLRGDMSCVLSENFSAGNFNLVMKVRFEDDLDWVVRLRMPPIEGFEAFSGIKASHHLDEQVRYEMQSELDTMEFLRLHTDIPIPQVHGHDLNEGNSVGFPFIVMDYVHGTTAEELSRSLSDTYGEKREVIPTNFRVKLWRQIASVMVKLANIRFRRSGSIIRHSAGDFEVSKFVDTGTGPYTTTKEFLENYPRALAMSSYTAEDGDLGQDALLYELNALAIDSIDSRSDETFGLANYDLAPNNMIVDHDFNVLAIIDWDSVVAVPDAALYRFPFLMGVEAPRPGVSATHPRVLEREDLGRAFARVVEQVSQQEEKKHREGIGGEQQTFFGFKEAGFYDREANIYRSLVFLRFKQSFVNKEWTKVLRWLQSNE